MKVLTLDGLREFLNNIRTLLNSKANTSHTHKYAGSSTAGGGATKMDYEVVFNGSASSYFETELTRSDCETYNTTVGVVGYIGDYHFFEIFPMNDFYNYGNYATGCKIERNGVTGSVRFDDNDGIIEVDNITLTDIVFYNYQSFYY